MVDLPLPDSPARPKISPSTMSKLTSIDGGTIAAGMAHAQIAHRHERLRRQRRSLAQTRHLAARARAAAQPRIADLVEREADEREREADQRHARARRHEGPPGAGQKRRVVARPVEVGAPGDGGEVAEAEELEADLRADGVDGRADERRRHQRRHVGQDLDGDDAPVALAGEPRGGDEVLLPQRQRLGAEDARAPRPAGQRQHEDEAQRARRQIGGDDDGERQTGDDEEDVGDDGGGVVDAAAGVSGADADDDADERDQDADAQGRCRAWRARRRWFARARPGPGRWCREGAATTAVAAARRARAARRRRGAGRPAP